MPVRLVFVLVSVLAALPASAQTVWYVDADATGSASGTSWADAFPDLQLALAAAEAGDEVWVAEGRYRPTSGSDRTISFVLLSGVALYGGFDGTESNRDERDWTLHETILSGDVGVPGDSLDNSYHVVVAIGVSTETILDGFTVQHGRANSGTPPANRGGGIYTAESDLVIRNCLVRWNGASFGGGIWVDGGGPHIEDTIFEYNLGNGGGATFSGASPLLIRLSVRKNRIGQLIFENGSEGNIEDSVIEQSDGFGLLIVGSSPRFVRTTIRDHVVTAPVDGGGAIIRDGAAPVFEDVLFEGNSAVRGSAAVVNGGASALFLRTVFRDNPASSDGAVQVQNSSATFLFSRFERNRGSATGGLFATGSDLTILATAFVGNTSPSSNSGGGALLFTGGTQTGEPVVIASSLFVGNEAKEGGAVAAFNVSPGKAQIVNTTFAANEGREVGGALYASNASGLEIHNSILWSNTAPDGPEVYTASGAPPMIVQSIVAGGYLSGTMILDEDPQFVRSPDPGPDNQWGTEDDDYGDLRLSEGSPAVDYGLAQYLPADTWDLDGDGDTAEPLPVDLQGGPRQLGPPDLGAYEGAVRVANEPGVPEAARQLAIWPNPASHAFRIRSEPYAEAVITDVLGRAVRRVALGADGVAEVETGGLAAGVYVVRAGAEAAVVTLRR